MEEKIANQKFSNKFFPDLGLGTKCHENRLIIDREIDAERFF